MSRPNALLIKWGREDLSKHIKVPVPPDPAFKRVNHETGEVETWKMFARTQTPYGWLYKFAFEGSCSPPNQTRKGNDKQSDFNQ